MIDQNQIWQLLENVHDPEIPVLSVVDLGVIRSIVQTDDEVEVKITPTYSGCPAMNTIAQDIRQCLENAGFAPVKVSMVLSPAWTTDWLSEEGKQKLLEYGIAPPIAPLASSKALFGQEAPVPCPQCHSTHTTMLSLFGSTACKALYRCEDCLEPFDYFKCLR